MHITVVYISTIKHKGRVPAPERRVLNNVPYSSITSCLGQGSMEEHYSQQGLPTREDDIVLVGWALSQVSHFIILQIAICKTTIRSWRYIWVVYIDICQKVKCQGHQATYFTHRRVGTSGGCSGGRGKWEHVGRGKLLLHCRLLGGERCFSAHGGRGAGHIVAAARPQ